MNLATYERAELARYAYCQAKRTGSLDCMKAVCYVLRNRLKSGWANSWLEIIIGAHKFRGNDSEWTVVVNAQDRIFQMLLRDIDDIYAGVSGDDTSAVVQDALYFLFVDPLQDVNPWFAEHVVTDQSNHPRIGQVGTMMLFK